MTLDNHYVHGGQGEMVGGRSRSSASSRAARVTRIGVTELPECGTNDEVLAHHGLDVAGARGSSARAARARRLASDRMIVSVLGYRRHAAHDRQGRRARVGQAVRESTGQDFELASIRVPGLTDYQIAVRTFEMLGVDADGRSLSGWWRGTRSCCLEPAAEAGTGHAERARDSRDTSGARRTCVRTC